MHLSTFEASADYPVPADALWALVVRYDALDAAAGRLASYAGLPDGEADTGQEFTVQIHLLGILPLPPWTIRILERDDGRRILRSEEWGGGVHTYRHTLEVSPLGDRTCRHTDRLEIGAGWQTPLVTLAARRIYRARHPLRRKLLGLA